MVDAGCERWLTSFPCRRSSRPRSSTGGSSVSAIEGPPPRVQARIDRAESGNLGDCKPVGEGVSEMRIDHGPGYRLYFLQRGTEVVILLVGGGKATQAKDIELAKQLASR